MRVVVDATIARPPMTGVQGAVAQEAAALERLLPDVTVFRKACLPGVAGRILWQQLCLPWRVSSGELLFSLGYTCPLHSSAFVALQVHDVIALEHPELCAARNVLHLRTLMPASIRRADAVLVSTNHVAERVGALFPQAGGRIIVSHLGVDYGHFAARQDAMPIQGDYFLFVGNLEPKKGLHVLLDAYQSVAPALKASLVLAGRYAWKSQDLRRRIEHWRGPGAVIVLGYVEEQRLVSLYQHAVGLVFPSLEEGFGLPVLEAQAAGCPVVHSDHPALCETAGGAGISCARGQAQALAEAMLALRQREGLRRRCRAEGALNARRHTWDAWARRVVDALPLGTTERSSPRFI